MIRFDNVSLKYDNGPDILKNISFSLPAGSFYFLTGASGAGKTSLLRLMYLGARPTKGHITLFDKKAEMLTRKELPTLRRRIGVVFQDFRLLPQLSALDNVALPLRLAGANEGDVRNHVAELLRWVGLGEHLHTRPYYLSGGQQQRIAIARAVITRPSLLVADEPTGNVDDETGMRLMHLFVELNRLGTTVVVASHNLSLIARLNKPRLVLNEGRLSIE